MIHLLNYKRLVLNQSSDILCIKEWDESRLWDKQPFIVPDNFDNAFKELSQLTGYPRALWFEALLTLDLKGRLWHERSMPLSVWLKVNSESPSQADIDDKEYGFPCGWMHLLKSNNTTDNHQIGAEVAKILEGQLWGAEFKSIETVKSDIGWQFYSNFISVWIAESIRSDMLALANHFSMTISDLIRNALLGHLFGRLGFEKLVKTNLWRPIVRGDNLDLPAFSKRERDSNTEPIEITLEAKKMDDVQEGLSRPERIKSIGKSDNAIKVWLPEPMKTALAEHASNAKLPVSQYCRNICLSMLYGRNYGNRV